MEGRMEERRGVKVIVGIDEWRTDETGGEKGVWKKKGRKAGKVDKDVGMVSRKRDGVD